MIRVASVEAIPITLRLAEGYRIAGSTITSADNVILKVDTADGRTGFGCAAPAEEVTGESAGAALRALDDVLIPLLRESDARDPAGVARRAARAVPGAPAARAAADIALHDLMGHREGLPLARVFRARRTRLLTSITLGISPEPDRTIEAARRHVSAGFRALKIKIGEDPDADARLVRALRAGVGPDVLIRADGNQGYSEEETRRFLDATSGSGLELLEQPTPSDDLEAMARLSASSAVPLMADEAILDARDAARICEARAAGLVNIKLMKCGGITGGFEIERTLKPAGVGAMIGCNDESRISIAAALHFALAAEGIDRADLDGHLDLVDDPALGGVRIEDGYIEPCGEGAGLGVRVDL